MTRHVSVTACRPRMVTLVVPVEDELREHPMAVEVRTLGDCGLGHIEGGNGDGRRRRCGREHAHEQTGEMIDHGGVEDVHSRVQRVGDLAHRKGLLAPSRRRNTQGLVPHQKLSSKANAPLRHSTRRPAQLPGCLSSFDESHHRVAGRAQPSDRT
jgi:hypothetical protein